MILKSKRYFVNSERLCNLCLTLNLSLVMICDRRINNLLREGNRMRGGRIGGLGRVVLGEDLAVVAEVSE